MSADSSATVKDQFPLPSAVVDPMDKSSAKSSTLNPASVVPFRVGVVSLLRSSESDLPVSDSVIRFGVEGASCNT